MAVGEFAIGEDIPIVPDSGEDGKIGLGAQEINRTRDILAYRTRLVDRTWDAYKDPSDNFHPTFTSGSQGDIAFICIALR